MTKAVKEIAYSVANVNGRQWLIAVDQTVRRTMRTEKAELRRETRDTSGKDGPTASSPGGMFHTNVWQFAFRPGAGGPCQMSLTW